MDLCRKDLETAVEALYWSAFSLEERLSEIPDIRETQVAKVAEMRGLRSRIKEFLKATT